MKYNFHKNKLFQSFAKVSKGNFRRSLSFRIHQLFQKLNKYPNDIVIETASVCNLNCTICRSVKADLGRKNRFMSADLFKKIIDDIAPICNTIGVSYCGEPLLNKDIFKMIHYATKRGLSVSMLTNGILLNAEAREGILDSGLNFMAVSMDGATKHTYESIRIGASFETLVENIRLFVKERKNRRLSYPSIDLQMVVTQKNIHEVDAFEKLARDLGVERAYLKSLHIDRSREDVDYVESLEKDYFVNSTSLPSRYITNEQGNLELKDKRLCPQKLQTPVITTDGDVLPCCFDIFGEHVLGNVTNQRFLDIWNSDKYIDFRGDLAMHRKLPMCASCLPSNYKIINKILF
ncbi:MAG TPA: radical SAM/SPASM domain-containing protein [Candidatus Wunengus sp. YC61]|uniref:radical SAM/SPASM domain-containing protein n=1 Tax=Candidatus Wunengus sp. YC61 TaxID=3367698 RepID=UPI004029DB40